jgi:hypothetical protein
MPVEKLVAVGNEEVMTKRTNSGSVCVVFSYSCETC